MFNHPIFEPVDLEGFKCSPISMDSKVQMDVQMLICRVPTCAGVHESTGGSRCQAASTCPDVFPGLNTSIFQV